MREFRGLFEVDLGRGLSADPGFFSLLLTTPSGAADSFPLRLKGSDLKKELTCNAKQSSCTACNISQTLDNETLGLIQITDKSH